ncbi:hypothetical protein GWI33_006131 [Rhynchophorus ferrugineus]|uniref:Methionine synthase reductase n=1 Tax=Rhynchophorus ferrugineus TaxID=354439 RepID=A0A834IGI0_RHYFE|nr:hypothetical protein GWI33_006131 [Rhynchophorus ferrugineus]
MSSGFLNISFNNLENKEAVNSITYRNKPFINSELFLTTIESGKLLTLGKDVKTVYQLKISRKNINYNFLPGDTIAILPKNNEDEVKELLLKLNCQADSLKCYELKIINNTTKKNPAIPKHIPIKGTLYSTFINNIDIRTPPKKLFLKQLIQYTKDKNEKELLEKICSPSGSKEYLKLITTHTSLLSLFKAFPSCIPPIELILEYSLPLQPRYYSIASSPLDESVISIIFYVLQHENGLKGVCTGWLEKIITENNIKQSQIPFYFRKSSDFRFDVLPNPSILIATGTGIAPFFAFLQHKKLSKNDEINNYVLDGTLEKIYSAFSRESSEKVYIQYRIMEHGKEILDLLLNKDATIYVCGDATTTVKSVKETIIHCLINNKNMDKTQAEETLANLIKDKKYLVDSWM